MKTNELMRADWVSVIGAGPAQVAMIDRFHVVTTLARYLVDARKLEPIEITHEILEANGFYKVSKDESENIVKPDVWIYEKNDNVIVIGLKGGDFSSFEIYNDRRHTTFTDRLCVSELQHAMRMMGMHELADNFIIEKGGQQ